MAAFDRMCHQFGDMPHGSMARTPVHDLMAGRTAEWKALYAVFELELDDVLTKAEADSQQRRWLSGLVGQAQ